MKKAVITGDLINSTRLSAKVRQRILGEIEFAFELWDKDFGTRSEMFRGDGFQCLVDDPADSLRICLIQKTFIRSLTPTPGSGSSKRIRNNLVPGVSLSQGILDARIAIGIGDAGVVGKRLATSAGTAFEVSGKLLDTMKTKKQALAIASTDSYTRELEAVSALLNAVLSRTTPLQCKVINYKLLGYTEMEIAVKSGIMQSAVNQRSSGGNWNALDTYVTHFEKMYGRSK
jgi:hypothetical protein